MRKYWGLLIVFVFSLGAIFPLLRPGFFPIHDDTQVVRVQQMALALRDGQLPVRWVADLGYGFGYPIFNFYAPLAYYVGGLLSLIGFDALLATKLMFIVGILLAGVLMYLLAREFWGEIGGILSGLFYVYAPYHAVDIYVRGAVAEFWAMAFLPLVFYSFYKLFQKKKGIWVMIGGVSYALVILSHNLTAMILTPFLIAYLLLLIVISREGRTLLYSFILGLGLAAFYWLPALFEMKLTKVFGQIGGGADWREHFVFLDQLWASPWGFGGSAPGRLDGMSFMIGKLHLVLAALSLIMAVWFLRKKEKKVSFLIFASFSLFALSIFLTTQWSRLIWAAIPSLAFIQYPWRFLVLATFAASLMAGSAAFWFKKKRVVFSFLFGGIVVLILLLPNIKYFQPQMYLDVSASDYVNEENIKWETSKISDEYLPKDFPAPENRNEVAWGKVAVLEGEAEIKNLALKSHQATFNIAGKTGAEILVNTAYFPGWKVWLDGREADFALEGGKIKISPLPGDHQISVRLTDTPIRTIANLISLVSWGILVGFMLKYYGWKSSIWRRLKSAR